MPFHIELGREGRGCMYYADFIWINILLKQIQHGPKGNLPARISHYRDIHKNQPEFLSSGCPGLLFGNYITGAFKTDTHVQNIRHLAPVEITMATTSNAGSLFDSTGWLILGKLSRTESENGVFQLILLQISMHKTVKNIAGTALFSRNICAQGKSNIHSTFTHIRI